MSRSQIVELLGEPDYYDNSSMVYKIEERFGGNINPVYTKILEVKLDNEKTAQVVVAHEWKK